MKCPVNKMPIAEHIVQSEMLSSGEPFQLLLLIEMSDLLRLDPCLCIAVVDTRGKRTRGLGMSGITRGTQDVPFSQRKEKIDMSPTAGNKLPIWKNSCRSPGGEGRGQCAAIRR